jgi:hypothetical protein
MVVMPTAIEILLPFLSTAVGAWVTYVVNVRQRRSNYVEDLFNQAIAAVAAAEASQKFINSADGVRADLEGEELRAFIRELRKVGIENEAKKWGEARDALAKVLPYQPAVRRYYMTHPEKIMTKTGEIIDLLREGPKRAVQD